MDRIDFLKTFIKDKNVGAVAKTSKFAVRKVCSHIDFGRDLTIVEYGPGDGVFTRYMLCRMTPASTLLAIDTNRIFLKHLESCKDERLRLAEGSAQNIISIMDSEKMGPADYVISGIPFTFFKHDIRASIVRNTHSVLKPNGKFLVYQYSPLMKRYLEGVFETTKMQFMPLNLPSMFIMAAQKS